MEEDVGVCGWALLPNEIAESILQPITRLPKQSKKGDRNKDLQQTRDYYESVTTSYACRAVCRQFRDLMVPFDPRHRHDFNVAAAAMGSISLLQWGRDSGCPLTPSVCSSAALGGHLEVLKWLREQMGCPWDESTCGAAARGGHLEVLEWAVTHGCPIDGSKIVKEAAAGGHLKVLQSKQLSTYPWDISAQHAAAKGGSSGGAQMGARPLQLCRQKYTLSPGSGWWVHRGAAVGERDRVSLGCQHLVCCCKRGSPDDAQVVERGRVSPRQRRLLQRCSKGTPRGGQVAKRGWVSPGLATRVPGLLREVI